MVVLDIAVKKFKNDTICIRCGGNHSLQQCIEELLIKSPNFNKNYKGKIVENKYLNILQLNVRGIKTNFGLLESFIASLNVK